MHVLVTLVVLELPETPETHVRVHIHYLHPDIVATRDAVPLRARDMLHTLSFLRETQRTMEAAAARYEACTGARPHLRRCLLPVLLHDACTLCIGCLRGRSWFISSPCESCGRVEYGASCTPPAVSRRGRLVHRALDDVVAFCWHCLARAPIAPAWQFTTLVTDRFVAQRLTGGPRRPRRPRERLGGRSAP